MAKDGFEALMAGRSQVVAGSAKNKVQAAAAKLMPSASARRDPHDDAFHLIDAAASRQGVSIGPG